MSDFFAGIRADESERVRVLLLLMAILSLLGCSPDVPTDEKAISKASGNPESKPVLVEIDEVKRGMIEEIFEQSAALEAEAQVQVLARTQNPAIELLVEEGDPVAQGQVLLRLEDDRQRTQYDQAMSQFEEARIEFARQESLYQQSLVSESEFSDAEFAFNRAKLQLESAKRELEYTEVRAPIQGTLTSRMVKVGDQVSSGAPIFEIIDLDSTVAVVHVPERYLPKLKANMEARLISSTFDDQVFAGFVKRIAPIVDGRVGTVKVVVGLKELGPLRPGVWVDVELVLDSKENAVLIPKRSIVYDNDQTFAFKVFRDAHGVTRAKRQLVIPRNKDNVHIEPMDGFQVGDRIVVAGQTGLKDDAPIREAAESDAYRQTPIVSGVESNSTPISAVDKPSNSIGN